MSAPIFEHATCSRCGGSGHYSSNQVDGTRCYGCGGSGVKLTKRGSAAQAFFNDLCSLPPAEVQDGMKVRVRMFVGTGSVMTWATITCRTTQIRRGSFLKDGVMVPFEREVVIFHTNSKYGPYSFDAGSKPLRVAQTTEARAAKVEQALAYQATLTKAGKPRR